MAYSMRTRIVIYTMLVFLFFLTDLVKDLDIENERLIRNINAQYCRVSLIINGESFFCVYPGSGLLEGGGFSVENQDPPIMVESMEFKVLEIGGE